jgi:catechol 2,3-dioxygenase-like lactoylglutathione lyase family enzyme
MISIRDIVYVRYQVPDLDLMERFLTDFGLHRAARTDKTLYMRGSSSTPYLHVTDLGPEVRSVGFGMLAQSSMDLEQLADENGVKVEDNPEPAGGHMVRLVDPSGFEVVVLHGIKEVRALPAPGNQAFNRVAQRGRFNQTQRLIAGPSRVHRLGHVALRVADFEGSYRFFTEKLGFRVSDSGYAGTEDNVVGHFLHCGLGKTYTDHHTIAMFKRPTSQFDHSAFEVENWDDLMVGNAHLHKKGWRHQWGVGRHVEGSQVFDYWRDPFGQKIEHWTDGDLVNEDYVGKKSMLSPEGLYQWGPTLPADFYL